MKKFFAVIMAIFIMLVPSFEVSAEETEAFNADAYTAFENLIVGWANAGIEMYPDYVGGVYFGADNVLVVALSDDTEANRNEINALAEMPDVIEFKTVSYSYNELQAIVDEVTYNSDNNNYDFLVNFVYVIEEENVVSIYVGSSELDSATAYFTSLYGNKVVVSGGYDVVSDTDFEEEASSGRIEKINSTKKLRGYISIGVIAVSVVIVLITTLKNSNDAKSSKRRYRK